MPSDERFSGPGPDQTWREHLNAGRIELQCCGQCAAFRFPPSLACTQCGSAQYEWRPVSGHGQVYSVTTVRERDGAYNVSIVQLAEGPRMLTRIEQIPPEEVSIGLPVKAAINGGDDPHLIFRPQTEAA